MSAGVRFPDLIAKKRDGLELSETDIKQFVDGVVTGNMADAQIGAMLMAIFQKGLSTPEVVALTREMVNSGETMSWPKEWTKVLMDKHSTGGVGDKISLVLMPALAALGMKVPTISGRGLAHTGGTLDKLEAIPGFNVSLTTERMTQILDSTGVFIAGQTGQICPADKKTYALRDVTATVNDIGLITASIVSKKIAENVGSLVLDVKTGKGAVMKELDQSIQLARSMVSCCKGIGVNCVALITDMDTPIGNMVGNALEVAESIQALQGKGPEDLVRLTAELGGYLLEASGHAQTAEEGIQQIRKVINDGSALDKFRLMMESQGVKADLARDLCDPAKDMWTIMTPAKHKTEVKVPRDGYVSGINSLSVAEAAHMLGGGRNKPGEAVNWAVGIQLLVDIGSQVKKDDPWAIVHHDDPIPESAQDRLTRALDVTQDKVTPRLTRLKQVITD